MFLCSSLLDLVGLGLIAPYMLMVINPESLGESYVTKLIEFTSLSFSWNELVMIMSYGLISIFFIKSISAIFINKKIISFSLSLQMQLKALLMESYQNLNYTEYLRRNSSEYVFTINSLTGRFASSIVQNFLKMLSEGISALIIIVMLAITNFYVLLWLLCLIIGLGFFYDRFFKIKVKEYGKKSNQYDIRMVQGINEGIEGLKEIRILGCERYFHEIVVENANKYAYYSGKTQVIRVAPRYLLELMLVAFIVVLVIVTILSGHDIKTLAPTLSLFGVASIRLIPSANILITGLSQMRHGRDSTSRLYRDVKKIDENSELLEKRTQVPVSSEAFEELTFNKVCFRYPSMKNNALNNLTLKIRKGDSIGLIGASGSGKTTLVDTMLGLLEVTGGDILFNGKTIKNSLSEWRANVAYLPQEVLLIDNTLRCNVALGVAENEIDEDRLLNALKQSRLHELVEQLPDKADTVLGERGVRLSGGQKQRVAIARAFYHARNVLIMDEATSALDNETEKDIVEEIYQLKGKNTLIVIAHRMSTVQNCDKIYRIENGEIIEHGSYASVIGNKT